MKWRQLLLFTAVRAVRVAHGQTLEDVLTSQAATLSTLNAWLLSEDLIFQIMSNAQGITLLAPSNNAINQLYTTALATQLASDPNLLTAFLSYHVLNGVYQMSDFTSNRLGSVPTFMNMHGYSNVSGGQTIETLSENGAVTFITGNGAETNVETYVRGHELPLCEERGTTNPRSTRVSRTSTTPAGPCTSSTPSSPSPAA